MGKTTCAAASAFALSALRSAFAPSALRRDRRAERVLVVSTDPAHSLGDALGVRLSARPRAVHGFHAMELDAPRAFARWVGEHRAALGDALEHGTWLDRLDVDELLDLPLPGVDELAGILEIARLAGGRAPYDVVIVDTAPTGHALRLLASPQTVAVVADALDRLQGEHRLIRAQFGRVGRPEAADRLIEMLAEQARETGEMLRDPDRTTFCWVTLPEALSLAESTDGIDALTRAGMRVAEVVVNRVLPDGDRCPVCDRRRHDERQVVAQIRRDLGRGRRIRVIPAEIREPRGIAALARIGKELIGTPGRASVRHIVGADPRVGPGGHMGPPLRVSLSNHEPTRAADSLDAVRGAKLLFVGGKGGVGKTTVAAAIAVRLARAHPRHRLLLLSTDPAHSVGDVLAAAAGSIGDAPAPVSGGPPNLLVREVDAARALAERRVDLEKAFDDIAASLGAGALTAGSRTGRELMDLAPPGIDELFGILSVVQARDDYDTIIVDTAPTGHALRLLELPDVAREWVQVLMRVLLKYKSLVRPGQLAADLVDVSKSIRQLQAMLRDSSETRFVVVTRAAEVPRAETERLLARLRRLELAVPAVVVNAMTLAPGRCRRCRATAAAEQKSLAALRVRCRSRSRECVIIQTPLSAPPPRGVRALEQWAERWLHTDG